MPLKMTLAARLLSPKTQMMLFFLSPESLSVTFFWENMTQQLIKVMLELEKKQNNGIKDCEIEDEGSWDHLKVETAAVLRKCARDYCPKTDEPRSRVTGHVVLADRYLLNVLLKGDRLFTCQGED